MECSADGDTTPRAHAGIASVNASRAAADDPARAATLYGTLRDLSEVTAADQRSVLVLVLADLPDRHNLEHLTYFRDRAQQLSVDYLSRPATLSAIDAPARALGVTWDRDAPDATARASAGYPYAVQVYAHAAWRAAPPGDRISLADARAGVGAGFEQMGRLYRSRWDALTARQKQYMGALAHLASTGSPVPTSRVASALGDPITSWSGGLGLLRDRQGAVVHSKQTVRPALPGWSRWIVDVEHREPFLSEGLTARCSLLRTEASENRNHEDIDPSGENR